MTLRPITAPLLVSTAKRITQTLAPTLYVNKPQDEHRSSRIRFKDDMAYMIIHRNKYFNGGFCENVTLTTATEISCEPCAITDQRNRENQWRETLKKEFEPLVRKMLVWVDKLPLTCSCGQHTKVLVKMVPMPC